MQEETAYCLREPSGGGSQPNICYPINTMVATRGGKDDMRTCFGIGEPGDPQFTISAAHEHGVCYSIEGHIIDRKSTQNGRGWADGYAHTLNATDRHGVVYPETARTLTAEHDGSWCPDKGPNILCYRNGGYGDMVEGVGTLRANGGDAGGVRRASSLNVFDARGNGEGNIAPTVTGDHNGHINDYMAVLVEKHE